MELAIGFDKAVADWVSERVEGRPFNNYAAIGLISEGKIQAGVILHDIGGGQASVTWAIDNPLVMTQRGFWKALYGWAKTIGVYRVNSIVKASDRRCRRAAAFLGFEKEGYLRSGWSRHQDAVVYGLLIDDWRFRDV